MQNCGQNIGFHFHKSHPQSGTHLDYVRIHRAVQRRNGAMRAWRHTASMWSGCGRRAATQTANTAAGPAVDISCYFSHRSRLWRTSTSSHHIPSLSPCRFMSTERREGHTKTDATTGTDDSAGGFFSVIWCCPSTPLMNVVVDCVHVCVDVCTV